jgi:MATE family multidrug resistance protein
LIARAAPVIGTMALGLPAALIAVACAVHLEAIGRAGLVARWLLGANLLNLVLGLGLIDGAFGFMPMGARGAAMAAALVRLALALGLIATLRAVEGPGLFRAAREPVAPGRQLGLAGAAAGTSAGMHALGVWLTIFAGWLGAGPLAAYASAWTLNLPGLVLALGIADAIAIRAAARGGDERDTQADLYALFAALAAIAFVLAAFSGPIARAYAVDPALQAGLAQVLPLGALALFLDGSSLGVFAVLRARGDIAAPTAIQIGSMAATAPLAWTLSSHFGLGAPGLFLAIAPTSAIRLALMSARLFRAPPALQLSETTR